jgi:hypothetical protein
MLGSAAGEVRNAVARVKLKPRPLLSHPEQRQCRQSVDDRPLRPVMVVCVVLASIGMSAWFVYVRAFAKEPFQDWMVFYAAARSYLGGDPAVLFDGGQLTAAVNHRFSAWLAHPLILHPWVYPPCFLAVFLPFGLTAPPVSLVAYELVGVLGLIAASRACFADAARRWMLVAALLLSPAAAFNVMTGQNAFFGGALLLGGLALVERRPLAAGMLLGLLSCKPQLWLLVPVALIAARRWRALSAMSGAVLLAAVAGLVLLGPEGWRRWLDFAAGIDPQFHAWEAAGRMNGISVFACARLAGATDGLASLLQGAASLFAGTWVYRLFRRGAWGPMAWAGLAAATILAAPHASTSDAILLGLAGSLYLLGRGVARPRPVGLAIAAILWACPLLDPPSVFRAGLLTPLLALVFLVYVGGAAAAERRNDAGAEISPAAFPAFGCRLGRQPK